MKKIFVSSAVALALLQGVSFAKTYAKVNGAEVTDRDISALMRVMPGVTFEQLPKEAQTQVVNQAIERKLLIEQAKKENKILRNNYNTALKILSDSDPKLKEYLENKN